MRIKKCFLVCYNSGVRKLMVLAQNRQQPHRLQLPELKRGLEDEHAFHPEASGLLQLHGVLL